MDEICWALPEPRSMPIVSHSASVAHLAWRLQGYLS